MADRLERFRTRLRDRRMRRRARSLTGHRLLSAFDAAYPDPFFVEIGANDGVRADPLFDFIRSGRWRGIMVEPDPHAFEQLVRNCGSVDGVVLENVAIGDRDGTRAFYRVAPPGRDQAGIGDGGYSEALGSFYEEVVTTTAAGIPGALERVERIEVRCLTFESLLRRHDVQELQLLAIDTEGYDYELIKQIDFERLAPRVLVYEQLFLDEDERLACSGMLEKIGYELMVEGFDTWCVDTRIDDGLTRDWRELRAVGPRVTEEELMRWLKGVVAHERGDPAP